MASSSDSTSAKTPLDVLTHMGRRKSFRSATQLLWNKLESCASLYLLSRRRERLTDEERDILEQCAAKLELARRFLDGRVKRPFSFWEVIHNVDGLLLLVIPEEMLPSRGLEILESFKRKVRDPTPRRLWLGSDKDEEDGPLPQAVHLLTGKNLSTGDSSPGSAMTSTQVSRCRHTLRGALGVIDAQTDLGFWQLSMNVSIQLLSGLLIILLLAVSVPVFEWGLPDAATHSSELGLAPALWSQVSISGMCGLIGATLSNMLSKESFKLVTGATVRWFFYYLFVKPLIGGFAALFVFLVERSSLLLEVVVGASSSTTGRNIVQINVETEAQAFLVRLALGLVAGFFADRVLSSMMERVLGRILVESEKTSIREPKPAGSAP